MADQFDEDLRAVFAAAKPLGRDEQRLLVEAAKNGNKEAKDKIVLCWLAFIFKRASYYERPTLPKEDLIQIGVTGICEAIDRFDLTRTGPDGQPISFSTYAPYVVNQFMANELELRSRVIALKRSNKKRRGQKTEEDRNRVLKGIVSIDVASIFLSGSSAFPGQRCGAVEKEHEELPIDILSDPALLTSHEDHENEHSELNEKITLLRESIRNITDDRIRQVILLRLQGKKFGDIANTIGFSKATASTLYHKGLAILREMMSE